MTARRAPRVSARSLLTLAALVATATLGCSEVDVRPADGTLWARNFLPFDAAWIRAATMPKEPQETPYMAIWEVSRFPPEKLPSAEERSAARELIESCHRSALEHGWYDMKEGLLDGYKPMFNDGFHYQKLEYIRDDHLLDPDRPEFLMYEDTPEGQRLLGFMFYARTPGEHGLQVGGNLTLWHFHVWQGLKCMADGMWTVGRQKNGRCERGVPMHRSPEMLHVWLIDHPDGRFATRMRVEFNLLQELLEKRELARPETVPVVPSAGS